MIAMWERSWPEFVPFLDFRVEIRKLDWMLIGRRICDGECAFYRAHAPRQLPVAELVRVSGGSIHTVRYSVSGGPTVGRPCWRATSL
jgi:hypothetical protein